jgi:hypothetical protein
MGSEAAAFYSQFCSLPHLMPSFAVFYSFSSEIEAAHDYSLLEDFESYSAKNWLSCLSLVSLSLVLWMGDMC